MNQQQYLEKLSIALTDIPPSDSLEILDEIKLHFNAARENHRTDESVSKALGSPEALAESILLEYELSHSKSEDTVFSKVKLYGRIITMGFKNIFLLPIFVSIGALVFSMYVTIYAFYFAGIMLIIAPVLNFIAPTLVNQGPLPIFALPIIGLIILYGIKKLHQYMSPLSHKLMQSLGKYIAMDYKKIVRKN